jgi:hypothetical protein
MKILVVGAGAVGAEDAHAASGVKTGVGPERVTCAKGCLSGTNAGPTVGRPTLTRNILAAL